MFTGIISGIGKIATVEALGDERVLVVDTPFLDVEPGESIAINGVCMTATSITPEGVLRFHASSETCARTNLAGLAPGQAVNLERALRMGDRLSGHLVQGHVDGLGTLVSVRVRGDSHELEVELQPEMMRYVIEKGSIALDGISLTVNLVKNTSVSLMIIPHTWASTTLALLRPGDRFNVELDMIAKYAVKSAESFKRSS